MDDNISTFATQLKSDFHQVPRAQATDNIAHKAELDTNQTLPPFEQVKLNIERAIATNNSTIKVILQPESLGTVDIHMEIVDNEIQKIEITAERRDTLELLQQEAKELHKLIQEVTKTEQTNLSFNFKQDNGTRQQAKQTSSYDSVAYNPQQQPNISQTISYIDGYRNLASTLNGMDIKV
jgi:flagellar hook-length control protein FliK